MVTFWELAEWQDVGMRARMTWATSHDTAGTNLDKFYVSWSSLSP